MSQLNYQQLLQKYNCNHLPTDLVEQMIKDRKVRIAICKEVFYNFFHFYFAHYVKYKTAPFQREIFHLADQEVNKNLFILAFRGSSKSTVLTTAYPIWAILGKQQKKFVLILCQTRSQAKQHMMNLRRELEGNLLLKNDLGPFQEENDEWGSSSLVFSKLNARITAASTEQSIRGLRHNQHRPDLIIGDDIEDLASSKTREGRQKTYQWLTGEVIPAGDRNTRLIIVGNLLHEDSLLMHLKDDLVNERIEGIYKIYPLIDDQGIIAWPGKYPTGNDIEAEKKKIGNEIAWQREYLLRIISDTETVVHPEWIHYYKEFPNTLLLYAATGVDLAISQKDTADFTAMVSARVQRDIDGVKIKIYILPNPINERMTFPQTVDRIKLVQKTLTNDCKSYIYIESVGFQEAMVQQLKREDCFYVEGVPLHGQDKRARLMLTTAMIQSGQIVFPEKGAEKLIEQMLGFGMEKNDDLVDAFTLLILKIMSQKHVVFIGGWI